MKPKAGDQAHHMLPKNKSFKDFFESNGIDVNDPQYMKWMHKDDHVGKFSSEYDKLWANFIENNHGKSFSKKTLMEKAIEFEKQATETAIEHKKKKK